MGAYSFLLEGVYEFSGTGVCKFSGREILAWYKVRPMTMSGPSPTLSPGEITHLLQNWRKGDRGAQSDLWDVVYQQLRGLAGYMVRERPQAASGPTTVVHEAYLRLLGTSQIDWENRRHFFAVAARAMRFVLVDRARERTAQKRSAEVTREIPDQIADPVRLPPEEVLAVHQALERLAEINPRQVKVVELHYFAGLSLDETAEVLDVGRATVVRDWRAVRAWLATRLRSTDSSEGAHAKEKESP